MGLLTLAVAALMAIVAAVRADHRPWCALARASALIDAQELRLDR